MNYLELSFKITPTSEDISDAIIYELGEMGFESFSYTEEGFNGYILKNEYDEMKINDMKLLSFFRENFEISYTQKEVEQQNWNKIWEDNFSPITVDNKIQVRAKFHPHNPEIEYDIIIEPKMSFGT